MAPLKALTVSRLERFVSLVLSKFNNEHNFLFDLFIFIFTVAMLLTEYPLVVATFGGHIDYFLSETLMKFSQQNCFMRAFNP